MLHCFTEYNVILLLWFVVLRIYLVQEVFTDGNELKLSRVLMLAKGTAVPKSFIVPLFALQAPANVISWIK